MPSLEQEVAIARNDGVTRADHLPFLRESAVPNGRGALLIHGFCATPREMHDLADDLLRQGYCVFGVRLPGHGTSPADLAHRNYEEWLTAVERGHRLLTERGLRVIGIGLSTGALVLLKSAASCPFVALVLLSPFLRLRHRLTPYVGLLHHLIPFHHRHLEPQDREQYYPQRPLRGIHQINRLRRRVTRELPRITAPTLVLTSEGDETIAPGTSRDLYRRLGSPYKKLHSFGREVPHVLTTTANPCQKQVFELIEEFLNNLPPTDSSD